MDTYLFATLEKSVRVLILQTMEITQRVVPYSQLQIRDKLSIIAFGSLGERNTCWSRYGRVHLREITIITTIKPLGM
jgi:hypothetical protein